MKSFKLMAVFFFLISIGLILICTYQSLIPLPASLAAVVHKGDQIRLLDRFGVPLSISYQSRWNVHDQMQFHEFPVLLKKALIVAEDKRFFEHHGQDWLARINASWQNLLHLRAVRGASTISEQVIKMIHPRSRTVWSRWVEGWEAWLLERNNSKQDILTFYLNQVPYAANRRGIKQATRYYFDRDSDTLNTKEMLALVVLLRAPSRMDLYKNTKQLQTSILKLGAKLYTQKYLTEQQYQSITKPNFQLKRPTLAVNTPHFVRYVLSQDMTYGDQWLTTLNGALQSELQALLDHRVEQLKLRRVNHAGLLVVDTQNSEILAWVVGGNNRNNLSGAYIDTITNYRQPGSALKPFLYALAMNRGWTAATRINDAPLSESVAYGMHQYKNYSRIFYGSVSVREALANSLNIPALKTIQYVGAEDYLAFLKSLGFNGLTLHPDIYGDGLALGNAEVSLFELVQAYSTLANRGIFTPLKVLKNSPIKTKQQIINKEISSLISDILSDSNAKRLEFGVGSVLNLPLQTAVKTGTSSDFRDSWAVAYNHQYIVGMWMGNLDNRATEGITGSIGPGLVLRSVFAILNRYKKHQPLYLSPDLVTRSVCNENGLLYSDQYVCDAVYDEYFVPGSVSVRRILNKSLMMRIRQPTPGLHLAVDPRVPITKQAFEFVFQGLKIQQSVDWYINKKLLALHTDGKFLWSLQRGKHALSAHVFDRGKMIYETPIVRFEVR